MRPLPIRTARHLHGVPTLDAYRERHREFLIEKARRTGDMPIIPWDNPRPLVARVDDGYWLGDCDCGSGVGVDPAWSESRCFACGAVYTRIELPAEDDRLNIEHVLAARGKSVNQFWSPPERLLDLAIENAQHGVRF